MNDSTPVLLVEDDPDDAALIEHAFKKAGIVNPLIVVADGEKAINYLLGNSVYSDRDAYPLPGLMLLDLKLPRRSGFEVLAILRANDGIKRIPVVVLTSSGQEADIKRAYDAGANSYLVKPVGGDALVAMVQSLHAFWIKLNRSTAS